MMRNWRIGQDMEASFHIRKVLGESAEIPGEHQVRYTVRRTRFKNRKTLVPPTGLYCKINVVQMSQRPNTRGAVDI
jgi:hypothetical protein